jgi:tetratricopeptide (TPR) repeat protein
VGINDHNYNPFVRTMSVAVDALSGRDAAPETRANIMKMVVERLQARLAAKPDEAISKIALMQMYLLLKQPNDALKVAQTTTPPAEDLAMRVLVLRQLALTKYQAQQYVESEKDFKELLTLVPKDIESLNNYAFMLADAMNQPQQAIDLIQKAIKVLNTEVYENQVTTAYASIYDTLGWAKFKAGDFQGAASAIQSSVQTQPSSDAYYHLARAYQRTGNLPGARLMCAEGIKFAKKRNDPILSELMTFQATLP